MYLVGRSWQGAAGTLALTGDQALTHRKDTLKTWDLVCRSQHGMWQEMAFAEFASTAAMIREQGKISMNS